MTSFDEWLRAQDDSSLDQVVEQVRATHDDNTIKRELDKSKAIVDNLFSK